MKKKLTLVALSLVVLSGCDVNLFNSNCRAIATSGYSLCRIDNGKIIFYLETNHEEPSGGGVLDGTVQSIGWSDEVIVARRYSTFRGDPDGLMVVNIASERVDGPISQDLFAKTYPLVTLAPAADVWREL